MKIALIAPPVPAVPLSALQREYYFFLFASRALSVFGHLDEKDFSRFWMLEPVHLGLLQLTAFLEENGIDCSFFASISPAGRESNREKNLLEKIMKRAGEFDLIGISSITASYNTAARMAAAIRKEFPKIPLAIGGAHAWACDEEVLRKSDFDFVVHKEGELTTLEMLHAIEAGKPLETVPGLSFLQNGKFLRTSTRPRMDRSILPIPAYDHLEDNFSNIELAAEPVISIPIARVTPTTGCTNNCVWCADYWKEEVSTQRLDRFAQEVVYLMERRNCRYFYLGTHNFFHDIDLALKIADTIGSLAPTMHWEAQTRVNPKVTREVLRHLVRSDCRCLHVGIESGNQGLLDAMGKNIRLDEARRMLEMAREEGIHTHTYWLIGSPFETRETAMQTIRTMRKWLEQDISSCSEINLLVGYPGTRFYREKDFFNITWSDPDFNHYDGRSIPTYDTKDLSRRDMEYLFHRALDEYCEAVAGKIGTRGEVLKTLGKRFPNFDPAFMEAAF
jgi:radical SAM superfamily enzyme YgiQ (UPF0313 family)